MTTFKSITEEMDRLQAEDQKKQQCISQLQSQLEQLQTKVKTTLHGQQREIEQLKAENQRLKEQMQSKPGNESTSELQGRIEDYEQQLVFADQQRQQLAKQLAAKIKELDDLQDKVKSDEKQ